MIFDKFGAVPNIYDGVHLLGRTRTIARNTAKTSYGRLKNIDNKSLFITIGFYFKTPLSLHGYALRRTPPVICQSDDWSSDKFSLTV